MGPPYNDAQFDEQVRRCIPAEFNMISAADDTQEAQEAMNTGKFELPNPNGKEGGACTSALLQVFYDNAHKLNNLTWVSVLQQMRCELKSMGYPQEPQLSSSRRIDVHKPVCLVPKGSGRRRALLIGINYGTFPAHDGVYR
jgi:metacaspase-1